MSLTHLSSNPDTPPLDPTAEHARAQLLQELSKPQYQPGRPTAGSLLTNQLSDWFNRLLDWIQSLFGGSVPGSGTAIVIAVVAALIIAGLIVGFVIFGVPRRGRRGRANGALFGEEDDRDSASLRRAAERAAASGDFTVAIEEQFRSIARGLAERSVLSTFPGTTAHGFAMEAATAFPQWHAELGSAANSFDAVRYLGRTGTEPEWRAVNELEQALRSARPVFDTVSA